MAKDYTFGTPIFTQNMERSGAPFVLVCLWLLYPNNQCTKIDILPRAQSTWGCSNTLATPIVDPLSTHHHNLRARCWAAAPPHTSPCQEVLCYHWPLIMLDKKIFMIRIGSGWPNTTGLLQKMQHPGVPQNYLLALYYWLVVPILVAYTIFQP